MVREILNEREKTYGSYDEVATVAQQLSSVLTKHAKYNNLHVVHQNAYNMIFVKMARSMCGDPTFIDTIDDIIGYGQLIKDSLERKAKSNLHPTMDADDERI